MTNFLFAGCWSRLSVLRKENPNVQGSMRDVDVSRDSSQIESC